MKLTFNVQEKRIIREQLNEMSLNAASMGYKDVSKTLDRLRNKFTDQNVYSDVRRHEADLLLDSIKKTKLTLDGISDKLKDSDKSKEEKEKNLEKTKVLIGVTESIIEKLEEKIGEV